MDPRALPIDCHGFVPCDLYEQRAGDLVLNRPHVLQLLANGLGGGVVGIGWRHDDAFVVRGRRGGGPLAGCFGLG